MKKKPNTLIITAITVLIFIQFVVLRPSKIEVDEEDTQIGMVSSISTAVEAHKKNDEIKYSLDRIRYASVENGKPQWEMTADQAVVYEKNNLVVADTVKMKMFDTEEKVTNIVGERAYFKMGSREMDLEGKLLVTFPDQFWVKTHRAHYSSLDQRVTSQEEFYGEKLTGMDELRIWGTGFLGNKVTSDIDIASNARVQVKRKGSDELTDVRSDQSSIDRVAKTAVFSMKDPSKFVEAYQGTTYVRSKTQNVSYDSAQSSLHYLQANDDVLIRETDEQKSKDGLKYATCQKAEFITKQNKILLSGFPSVYQNNNAVTGDVITVFRDKNIVEVTEANAYHDGNN